MIISKKQKRLHTVCTAFFIFFTSSLPLYAQSGINLFPTSGPFTVSVKTDASLLGSAAAVFAGSLLLEKPQTFNAADIGSADSINDFDRTFMQSYNADIDTAADIMQYTAILLPAVLMTRPLNDWTTIGVMYFESAALAFGLKDLGKALFHRTRPFMYFDDYPQSYIDDDDWNNSFPSGHTTMAFNGAVFLSYVFAQYNPDSPWKIPVTAASLSLAAATGIMRIAGGCHFPTDVIAGAAIGSLTGFIVPYLHQKFPRKNKQTSFTPLANGFMVSIAL